MQTLELTFYDDPGHAWLEVPIELLKKFDIQNEISHYSYLSRDGKHAYLEEDCDAGKFMDAVEGKIKVSIKTVHQDPTPIRNYPDYDPVNIS